MLFFIILILNSLANENSIDYCKINHNDFKTKLPQSIDYLIEKNDELSLTFNKYTLYNELGLNGAVLNVLLNENDTYSYQSNIDNNIIKYSYKFLKKCNGFIILEYRFETQKSNSTKIFNKIITYKLKNK